LKNSIALSVLGLPALSGSARERHVPDRTGGASLKLSLNAYSFNGPLRDRAVDLFDLLEYCAREGYDALDPTGYYFPGYPEPPSDRYLYDFKRRASILGIDLSGTGVRNDFTVADRTKRLDDVEMVKKWAEAASKAGLPLIRLFAGRNTPGDHTREEITGWLIEDLARCAEIGKAHGVMMALQNHNDFLKTADQVTDILDSVQSEWLGVHLDIGSFSVHDPYDEIERLAPYAINWQIKEEVWQNGHKVPTDLERVFGIIKKAGYRGYLPLETLGPDAAERLPAFHQKAKKALEAVMH
jgi:sugar phosphate isomerase/epimerase